MLACTGGVRAGDPRQELLDHLTRITSLRSVIARSDCTVHAQKAGSKHAPPRFCVRPRQGSCWLRGVLKQLPLYWEWATTAANWRGCRVYVAMVDKSDVGLGQLSHPETARCIHPLPLPPPPFVHLPPVPPPASPPPPPPPLIFLTNAGTATRNTWPENAAVRRLEDSRRYDHGQDTCMHCVPSRADGARVRVPELYQTDLKR